MVAVALFDGSCSPPHSLRSEHAQSRCFSAIFSRVVEHFQPIGRGRNSCCPSGQKAEASRSKTRFTCHAPPQFVYLGKTAFSYSHCLERCRRPASDGARNRVPTTGSALNFNSHVSTAWSGPDLAFTLIRDGRRHSYISGGTVAIASSSVESPSFTFSRLSWCSVFIPPRIAIFFNSADSSSLLMPSINSSFVTISS